MLGTYHCFLMKAAYDVWKPVLRRLVCFIPKIFYMQLSDCKIKKMIYCFDIFQDFLHPWSIWSDPLCWRSAISWAVCLFEVSAMLHFEYLCSTSSFSRHRNDVVCSNRKETSKLIWDSYFRDVYLTNKMSVELSYLRFACVNAMLLDIQIPRGIFFGSTPSTHFD